MPSREQILAYLASRGLSTPARSGGGGASFTGVRAGTYELGGGSITINGRGQITAIRSGSDDAQIFFFPPTPIVEPPSDALPPAPYTVPGGGVYVTNMTELATAWAGGTPTDIVLADGIYDQAGPLPNINVPHRLWAENLLGAELRIGLSWGNNTTGSAGELHGIAFNVDDIAKVSPLGQTAEKCIVLTWMGPAFTFAGNLVVEDCTFDMNSVIGSAIQATSPQNLQIRRCEIRNGIHWGILAFRNTLSGSALLTPMQIEDVRIERIRYPVQSLSNGGQGIWVGHRANVLRTNVSDVDWAGLAVVNDASNVLLQDIIANNCQQGYLDPGGRGIYLEQCHDVQINRYYCGPESMFGISAEWNLGNSNPYLNDWVPRNYDVWVNNANINSYKIGISWDMTVQRCQVQNSYFSRSWRAAILDYNEFLSPPGPYLIQSTNVAALWKCIFRLADVAPSLLHAHHLTYLAPPPPGWPSTPAGYNEAALNVHTRRYVEIYAD